MAKLFLAYTITEHKGVKRWLQIGVAFPNRDGSFNVKLDALPTNGELQIRKHIQREEHHDQRRGGR